MSDLFGNHIVGFPTRRLNYHQILRLPTEDSLNFSGHVADALQRSPPDVFVTSDGGYTWRKVRNMFCYC